MIYQQDWLMRQIEAMIQAVLDIALQADAPQKTKTKHHDIGR